MAPTYVLGLHTSHDASACLLRDGQIRFAIERERLTRCKHENGRGGLSDVVNYVLQAEGIPLERIDRVVVCDIGNLRGSVVFSPRETRIGHHLAHAWAAAALSGFAQAAVLVVDGEGSFLRELGDAERDVCCDRSDYALEKESAYVFRDGCLQPLKKWVSARGRGPFSGTDGVAAPYWFLSQLLFGRDQQESKVMGLAALGRSDPRYGAILGPAADGSVAVSRDWIFRLSDLAAGDIGTHQQEYANLAATVQLQFEEALLHIAHWLHATTAQSRLCFAGGAALNCVAAARLAREGPFAEVFVPFGPGDSSIAVGCAYYGWHTLAEAKPNLSRPTPFLGMRYSPARIEAAIASYRAQGLVAPAESYDAPRVASAIAEGAVVGFFQGASEFGPRALGHRSILADPRTAATKDRLNARVKYREFFRPFAPAVLEEEAHAWFEDVVPGGEAMQFIARVRGCAQDRLAAVTHVDGTARVQLVNRQRNPELYDLIAAFRAVTGVPVLLNTSLNVSEPIVETPEDALKTFVCSSIDTLVLHNWVLTRAAQYLTAFPPDSRTWDRLVLVWHEPFELGAEEDDGRRRYWLQRSRGREELIDDGYRIRSYRHDPIDIPEQLHALLLAQSPRPGLVTRLSENGFARTPVLRAAVERLCTARIASLTLPLMATASDDANETWSA
ncbi:MAG: carbamoyltransferase [Alphaproteobacteria bacterium]|nr:MAG: carbamoyltransferase [Alphaproteobacteria bacterium]